MFATELLPFRITPFLIAPVLPNDTLREAMLRARAISDPVKSRHCGAWLETMMFYVPVRRIAEAAAAGGARLAEQFFIDPTKTLNDINLAGGFDTTEFFEVKTVVDGGVPIAGSTWHGVYMLYAYRAIVEDWFRDEGEDADDHKIGEYCLAKVRGMGSHISSMTNWSDVDDEMHEVDVDADGDGTITVEEVNRAMATWNDLNARGLVQISFEDYLEQYGVRTKVAQDDLTPELLRLMVDWQYPISAIDPTDGSAASALTWTVDETLKKPKNFKEPGFIIGLQVMRPFVMFSAQGGYLAQYMASAYDWLPASLMDSAIVSIKKVPGVTTNTATAGGAEDASGPFPAITDDYQLDLRDLFMYGDQFWNFDMSASTWCAQVGLPTAALEKDYPTDAMGHALFVGGDGSDLTRCQGFAQFQIASPVQDLTPYMTTIS